MFTRKKMGTPRQELARAVAQVGVWVGSFAAFRGGMSILYADQPPAATSDFFAYFCPTFGAVCLLAGPLLAVGCFIVRFQLTPKG
jgi:hypothetical protein